MYNPCRHGAGSVKYDCFLPTLALAEGCTTKDTPIPKERKGGYQESAQRPFFSFRPFIPGPHAYQSASLYEIMDVSKNRDFLVIVRTLRKLTFHTNRLKVAKRPQTPTPRFPPPTPGHKPPPRAPPGGGAATGAGGGGGGGVDFHRSSILLPTRTGGLLVSPIELVPILGKSAIC